MPPGSFYRWLDKRNKAEPVEDDESPMDFSHSGLGIGGAGSHDLHDEAMELVARGEMEIRPEPELKEGDYVYPAGTTQGKYDPDGVCGICGKHGDWNPGAGQNLCARHWDEY
jgi:hypothetical protein